LRIFCVHIQTSSLWAEFLDKNMWKMDPMSGCDIRLVFTLPHRDSTLQYKIWVHLWNNFPYIITLHADKSLKKLFFLKIIPIRYFIEDKEDQSELKSFWLLFEVFYFGGDLHWWCHSIFSSSSFKMFFLHHIRLYSSFNAKIRTHACKWFILFKFSY